jgi:hypothetical protein
MNDYRATVVKEDRKETRMSILRIEHPVADYTSWKEAFDATPRAERAVGVRSYRVMRPVDDARYVLIDLEFDSPEEADSCSPRCGTSGRGSRGA